MTKHREYDLEERLLEFAARVVRLSESLPRTRAGKHVSDQILRSGTAPMAHHAEAQAAESRRDFIHKMKLAHKELRETRRWMQLTAKVPLIEDDTKLVPLLEETSELIRIFHASLRTAEQKPGGSPLER